MREGGRRRREASVDKLTGAGRGAVGPTGVMWDDGSDQRRHSCL